MKDRIKAARQSAHLKQYELAEAIGVSRNFFNRIEKGTQTPSDRTLKDIARVTNTNYLWLKDGTDEMKAPSFDNDAALVSDILEQGRNNPLYDTILDIVDIYGKLSPTDKAVIDMFVQKLKEKN